MLLSNWNECLKGDYRYTRKKVDLESEETDEDKEAWFKIYDGYIEKYGLSDIYTKMLKIMKKKAILELQFVQTRDRFLLTLIGIQEEKLRKIMSRGGKGQSTGQSLVHLSKWYGIHLKPTEITVVEYQDILLEYARHNKAK